jgi:hypothetical protein
MQLAADAGLTMILLSAPAGSAADDALRLLASWAASRDQHPHGTRTPAKGSFRAAMRVGTNQPNYRACTSVNALCAEPVNRRLSRHPRGLP